MRKQFVSGTVVIVGLLLAACSGGGGSSPTDEDSPAPAVTEESASRVVTYEVTGDGTKAGSITYLTFNGGSSSQQQEMDAAIPWTKEVAIDDPGLFTSSIFSLVAQAGDGTTISCKITADGEVIQEATSTGQYSVVTCSGSAE